MLVQIRTFLTLSVLPFLFKRTFRSLDSVLRLKSILSRVQSIEVVHIFETSFKKKKDDGWCSEASHCINMPSSRNYVLFFWIEFHFQLHRWRKVLSWGEFRSYRTFAVQVPAFYAVWIRRFVWPGTWYLTHSATLCSTSAPLLRVSESPSFESWPVGPKINSILGTNMKWRERHEIRMLKLKMDVL